MVFPHLCFQSTTRSRTITRRFQACKWHDVLLLSVIMTECTRRIAVTTEIRFILPFFLLYRLKWNGVVARKPASQLPYSDPLAFVPTSFLEVYAHAFSSVAGCRLRFSELIRKAESGCGRYARGQRRRNVIYWQRHHRRHCPCYRHWIHYGVPELFRHRLERRDLGLDRASSRLITGLLELSTCQP